MRYEINLFPKKEVAIVSKAQYFVSHYLRYILVLTQFVVICVFFYRFSIDQLIIGEKEKLAQKRAIINATKPLRDEMNKTQKSIKSVQTIFAAQDLWTSKIDYLLSIFPVNVTLTSLKDEGATLRFAATATSPEIIKKMYNRLLADKQFGKVQLGPLTIKNNTEYQFDMTLDQYKPSPI